MKKLAERVRRLEWFVKECRDNFDCDHDAHLYKTTRRACAAAALMPNTPAHHGRRELPAEDVCMERSPNTELSHGDVKGQSEH